MTKAKTPQQMFGADTVCLATMLHLVSLTNGYHEGSFKAGFESAIEEAGAYLDSLSDDGGTQAQTLMEQMLGLVNGQYALTEVKGPMGAVITATPSTYDDLLARLEDTHPRGSGYHETAMEAAKAIRALRA